MRWITLLTIVCLVLGSLAMGNGKGNGKGNGNNKNKGNGNGNKGQKVQFFPCKTTILKETHLVGGPPGKQRTWEGVLDLSAIAGTVPRLIVTMIFDYPAAVTLIPEEAEKLKGSKGNYIRFVVFPEVMLVNFKVKSRPDEPVANVISLVIDNKEKCEAAKKWDDAATIEAMPPPPPPRGSTNPEPQEAVLQPVIVTTTPKPKPQSSCGVRQIEKQAYVTNGYASTPGDWPWHAALYHKTQRTLSYKCGSTLITSSVVITAAHCLWDQGSPIVASRVIIQLGKYNLQFNDINTAEYQVYEIKMHEKYSNFDYNDDIALLKLAQQVTFTRYIQPCCLWPQETKDLSAVVNRKGFVVGWGLQEDDDLADTLTEATMPVVDFFTCLESNRDFFGPVLSEFNYCAGYKNGTSVCNGDSGGGMFFNENGVWHLRGLVSFSSVREDRNVCNPLEYVVFTDVAKYLPWIQENMV